MYPLYLHRHKSLHILLFAEQNDLLNHLLTYNENWYYVNKTDNLNVEYFETGC